MTDFLILVSAGLVAGTIDAIAGGGGLVTLPILTLYLDAGAHAIGTNKIVGTLAALVAFVVYWRNQKLNLKRAILFLVGISSGAFFGARSAPYFSADVFRGLLLVSSPFLLWIIWKKSIWMGVAKEGPSRTWPWVLGSAAAIGFYDGFFGPGGGTFMLLGLLLVCRLPLMESLLISKLANTFSAGTSLVTYGLAGYVHWKVGLLMSIGVITGAFFGSRLASKRAEVLMRPVLTIVVFLLMITLIRQKMNGS